MLNEPCVSVQQGKQSNALSSEKNFIKIYSPYLGNPPAAHMCQPSSMPCLLCTPVIHSHYMIWQKMQMMKSHCP